MSIYTGTYGFRITIPTGRDLTYSTDFELKIQKPDRTVLTKALTDDNIVTPKSAGNVFYDAEDGDFSVVGAYKLQLFDQTGTGNIPSDVVVLHAVPSVGHTE